MNSEEYKAALLADPSFDADGKATDWADSEAYRDEIRALDEKIARALAIDVPELAMPELPDIETEKVVTLAERRRVSTPVWLAMAATVVLAAFLGVRFVSEGPNYDSLADEVLAHMEHEPYAMRVSDVPVSNSRLSYVVAKDVARMDHDAGLITYAQTCIINGHKVPHLVIQGERGPVTILLMPNEKVSEAVPLRDEFFEGAILPVGDGSIAVIGGHDENLDKIQESVMNSVTWST